MNRLVQSAKNGNKNSFIKLINSIKNDLYRIAKVKLSNEDDINDILQDTILDIYSSLDKLQNNSFFKTWCIRILINNCNDKLKEKYKIKNIMNYDTTIDDNNYISDDDVFNTVYTSFDYIALIEVLSENERLVFTLYYEDELKIKEISQILDVKENTIKSIIRRGKQKIKQKYGKENIYG